jgi:cytosine/adenosine deaminase-related metal-dependent hydrolase
MDTRTRAVSFCTLLLFIASCENREAPQTATPAPSSNTIAFVDVTIIPMDSERTLRGHTVLVEGDRISAVGPADEVDVPQDAVRVDGAGKYLMPGLAEMHAHIPGTGERDYAETVLFLYVANGVTTIRGMAGDPLHLELREQTANGELLGPAIYAAAPGISGNNAATPAQAERAVRERASAGYDLLKVFEMPTESYEQMARTAHEVGIPFAGHVPEAVGLTGALDARQASIDHLDRYVEFLAPGYQDMPDRESGFFGSGVVDLADAGRIPEAVERTVAAGTWVVPTLTLVEHLASPEPAEQMIRRPEMRYLEQAILDDWVRAKQEFGSEPDFQPAAAEQLVELRRQLVKALHEGGAHLALGSDSPQFFNVPGFSIHHEMSMMVDAGLTPFEVLVTGTRNPAAYFGVPEEFGTVQAGRRADLILLTANPLEDVANVKRRAGVMVRGRWLPESEIQARLEQIAQAAASSAAN